MSQDKTLHNKEAEIERIAAMTGESKAVVAEMYDKIQNGATLAEVFNMPEESLEAVYAIACTNFVAGKIEEAETLFRTLCQYNENSPKYWMGVACCLEKQGKYGEAALYFAHVGDLDKSTNYKALYFLAQCCCALKDKEAAKRVLEVAVNFKDECSKDQVQYRKMAQDLLTMLSQE